MNTTEKMQAAGMHTVKQADGLIHVLWNEPYLCRDGTWSHTFGQFRNVLDMNLYFDRRTVKQLLSLHPQYAPGGYCPGDGR